MPFDRKKCIYKPVYCGTKKLDTTKYSKKGTGYECLKQGFGVADWTNRKKGLSETSLQQIKYVGPVFEENFKKKRIYSLRSLLTKMDSMTASEKKKLLKEVFTRSNGCVDYRGYNSVLLYLDDKRVTRLPKCETVKNCNQ